MATDVLKKEELTLGDGTTVTIRPLPISGLRKFAKIMKGFDQAQEDEDEALDILVNACQIALSYAQGAEKYAENAPGDKTKFTDESKEFCEDNIDLPMLWKILEVAGGVQQGDPNPLGKV